MGYYKKLYNKLYYYIAVCLLTVGPAFAEGDTNNSSNPVAAATGNVTNQAVQFQTMEHRLVKTMVLVYHVMDLL